MCPKTPTQLPPNWHPLPITHNLAKSGIVVYKSKNSNSPRKWTVRSQTKINTAEEDVLNPDWKWKLFTLEAKLD